MLQKATGLRDASTPSRGRKPPLHCFAFSGACLIALLCLAIPIAAQQDQRLVYAAAEGSGTATISGWVVNTSNGTLSVIPGSPFSEGFDPHSIAIDPSGKFLYVVNVAQNDVSAFTIDATTGALAPVPNSPFAVGGGTNPVAIVCEPSGGYVYVANGTSNNSDTGKWEGYEFGSVNSYSIDPSTGALIPTTTPSLDLTDTFVSPIALFADPAGGTLYVFGGGENGDADGFAVETLQIDPSSGNLTEVNSYLQDQPYTAYSAAISPNGKLLFLGVGENEGDITELSTGDLSETGGFGTQEATDWPLDMAVDSTNSYLYVDTRHDGLIGISISSYLSQLAGSPFKPPLYGQNGELLVADPTGPFLYASTDGAFEIGTDGTLTSMVGFSVSQASITGIGTYGPSITIQPVSNPVATFTPPSLSFASQAVNTTSAAQQISLSNTGNEQLVINANGISITGTNAADFAIQSSTCTSSVLLPNASCTFMITYDPAAAGSSQAFLTISDNVSGGTSFALLSGTAFAPVSAVTLVPGSLTFANTNQGATSASQSITLTNSGTLALQIPANGVTLSGPNPPDFSQTNTCNGDTIAINGTCTISVTFQPQALGLRTADVQIADNAPGSPQSVGISGTGQAPFTLSSSGNLSQTVTAGAAAQYNLQLAPVGGFQGTVSLSCTGVPAGAVCTVPSAVQISGPGAVGFNVTVSTTARSSAPLSGSPGDGPLNHPWFFVGCGFCGGLLLLLLFGNRKKAASVRSVAVSWSAAIVLFAAVLAISSCGGSSPSSAPDVPGVPGAPGGTPSGSSTLTVTASTQGDVVETFNLTLNVQ